jgi:hypothetical protein
MTSVSAISAPRRRRHAGAIRNYPGAVLLALMILVVPARAADPVFPVASLIGLVPPGDMVPSQTFRGFTDVQRSANIIMITLPAAAYETLVKSELPEVLRKQGISITIDKREPIELNAGKGILITGTEKADKGRFRKLLLVLALHDLTGLVNVEVPEADSKYSDDVLRAALATLTQRASVPDAEQLSLLPFTVGDLAGFHIGDLLPGRAVVLIDARGEHDANADQFPLNARLMIAAHAGGPAEPTEWANFARIAFDSIGGIKDVRVQLSEPLRIGAQPGFQTLAKGKDDKSGADIMVVQWLRFGSGAFMQMVGIARADVWSDEFPRLRTVRDSVDPR